MTKEQKAKLDVLVNFLTENKILFFTTFKGKIKVSPELYIPKFKIMVKVSQSMEDDNIFYNKVKFAYHPLFIRETETKEFVLEKMQNLIIDLMKQKQIRVMRKNTK